MEDPEGGYLSLLAEAYKDNKILYETFADELQGLGLDAVDFITAFNEPVTKGGKDVLALPEAPEKSGPDTPDPVG